MAMLFGTLLSMQRLSGDSEITALKAGGISLVRMFLPLAAVGLVVSLVSLIVQEELVPLANDRAAYLRESVDRASLAGGLEPHGRRRRCRAAGSRSRSRAALDAATQIAAQRHRAALRFQAAAGRDDRQRARALRRADVDVSERDHLRVHDRRGQRDAGLAARSRSTSASARAKSRNATLEADDPENLSRSEIRSALDTSVLSDPQRRLFAATYAAKLARPFSAFVFVLFGISARHAPHSRRRRGAGLRSRRSSIVFVYYVITTVALSIGSLALPLAGIAAWTPNALFSLIGLWLLRRASAV